MEVGIPTEVKDSWSRIVTQAGTYARALVSAMPLRLFSLVIGVNHKTHTLRFLIYHRGGLTASHDIDLDEEKGRRDVQRILFSILLWQTPDDAGFPAFTNGLATVIPSEPLTPSGPSEASTALELPKGNTSSLPVFTDKVFFHSTCVRGRGTLVIRGLLQRPSNAHANLIPPYRLRSRVKPGLCEGELSCCCFILN